MSLEQPALAAVVARLADPEIHLAAYGGVVFPLALIIEAPVIMMLAASTALSKDRASYLSLQRFMHRLSAGLTATHALMAFTPLYDVVVVGVMGVPPEIVEPARIGLQIMTPWTWAIAYRRFQQGVLIRFGHSRAVTVGTMIRLVAALAWLGFGYTVGDLSGIVVASATLTIGVVAEALYAAWRVRPVVRDEMEPGDPAEPLRGRPFLDFYVPLAMTSLITLVVQPIGSAAISRMPDALASLAVWPVVNSLAFLFQSVGLAYQEVVVAMLGRPRARTALRHFATVLSLATTALVVLLAATPLSGLWFAGVSGLSRELSDMAGVALWLAVPIPAMRAMQSWYQGVLVHVRRTGPITESVAVFLLVCTAVMWAGVETAAGTGVYVAVIAFSVGRMAQTAWVLVRSRPARRSLA